jgi:4'-phosphopantetheinyl transferase
MAESSASPAAAFSWRDLALRREGACVDGVTLRLVDVAPESPRLPGLLASLSVEEQARAARFRSEADRLRFALTRTALRHFLGEATGSAPEALVFATGPRGKPSLADRNGPYFNVSHSGSLALIGISRLRPIGVDIEWARDIPDMLGISEACFSARESRTLVGLPPGERKRAFYAIWTGKEALLKALGTGIDASLRDFSVTPTSMGYSVVPETPSFGLRLDGLSLERLEVPENYAAAFALA